MSDLSKYRYSTEVGNHELLLSVQRMRGKMETVKRSPVTMDIETLRSVTNYCHWIPITQGLYKTFFQENFTGWQWNDFVPKLLAIKILRFRNGGEENLTKLSQGLYISPEIEAIEFRHERSMVKVRVISKEGCSYLA